MPIKSISRENCTAPGPAALLGPVLREDGGGALGDLAHAGEEVEPGDGDLAQRRLVRKTKYKQTADGLNK